MRVVGTDSSIKDRAISLRKQRKSYNEISQSLGISKGTLSYWFSKEGFSEEVKQGLLVEKRKNDVIKLKSMVLANKMRWEQLRFGYRDQAIIDFETLAADSLFNFGVALYWGEGDKSKGSAVRLNNTDPKLLLTYLSFLRNCCRVADERIKIYLLLYPDHDDAACIGFWSKTLKVSAGMFAKPVHIIGRHKFRRLDYGVCTVQINSRELKEKMLKWIDLFADRYAGIV